MSPIPVQDPPNTYKDAVLAASTANLVPASTGTDAYGKQTITLSGTTLTLDGVVIANGNRILLKDQATASQNGVFTVSGIGTAPVLTRALDAWTAGNLLAGLTVSVLTGTANGGTVWTLMMSGAVTPGTTALPFGRTWPPYEPGGFRDPWLFSGGGAVIATNAPRQMLGSTQSVATGGTQVLAGGLVVPAGRPVTNINFIATTAGAAPTVSWLALVRQSDRVVLAHTANVLAAPTASVVTSRPLTGVFTSNYDVPCWVVLSYTNSTTAMVLLAAAAQQAAAIALLAPALSGTNGVAPTTTLPTDGTTVITAASTGLITLPIFWLT